MPDFIFLWSIKYTVMAYRLRLVICAQVFSKGGTVS